MTSPSREPRAAFGHSRRLVAAALLAALAGCGAEHPVDPETTARLIQPVARWTVKQQVVEAGKRTGEEVVAAVCAGCHAAGSLGAPKTGDKAAWGPRIAQGFEALVAAAIHGKNQMPPRGGAADLSDAEVARAVAYLANQAGADFAEPPP